jgi:hypothetical protein
MTTAEPKASAQAQGPGRNKTRWSKSPKKNIVNELQKSPGVENPALP